MGAPPTGVLSYGGGLMGQISRGLPFTVSTRPVVTNFKDSNGVPDCQTDPSTNARLPAHVVLSPMTATCQPTMGFLFTLLPSGYGALFPAGAPYPSPGGGPFTIQVWARDPGAYYWIKLALLSSVAFKEWWVCNDVDVCELYFQLTGGVTGQGYLGMNVIEI